MSSRGAVSGRGRGIAIGGVGRTTRLRAALDGFARKQTTADDDSARETVADNDDVLFRQQIATQSSEVTAEGCLKQALATAFDGDDEEEMNVDSVEFSLICPYSRTRMVRPVSCVECNHIQCMDMDSAVRVLLTGRSMKNPRGCCPRCGKTVRLSQMYVNPWMAGLLKSFPNNEQLVLTPDGNVRPKGPSAAIASREVIDCIDNTQEPTDIYKKVVVVKREPGAAASMMARSTDQRLPTSSSLLPTAPSSELPPPTVHMRTADPPFGQNEAACVSPPVRDPQCALVQHQAAMAVATFEGLDPTVSTSQHGPPSPPLSQNHHPHSSSAFFSVLPTLSGVRRLNRGIIDRNWQPICTKCGKHTIEQHDPDTGVLEEGCCGVIAPRSEWPLERVVGSIKLRLLPDDLLLVIGRAADYFGSKLLRASFYRAEADEGFYFGFIDSFGRYEIDYLFAMCNASANGPAGCAAITPTPEIFRDWVPRARSSSYAPWQAGAGGGGGGGFPSQTQGPHLSPPSTNPYGN